MILFDKFDFTSLHWGGATILAVYTGVKIVWQSIKSCFGAGFWRNAASWLNTDGWKNN